MQAKLWWQSLSAKEQQTLRYGGICLAILLFVFALWLPLVTATKQLKQDVQNQQKTLNYLIPATGRILKSRTQKQQSTTVETGDSLIKTVDLSLKQSALTSAVATLTEVDATHVQLSLQKASFDTLASWLTQLWREHAIKITAMQATHTASAGQVNVKITLAR